MKCNYMTCSGASLPWSFSASTREELAERMTVIGLGEWQGRAFPNAKVIK